MCALQLSKEVVKANSALQTATKNLENADADIVKAETAVLEAQESVKAKKEAIAQDHKNSGLVQQEAEEAEKEYQRLQEQYQNMCAGISSSEGDEAKSLPSQISGALSDANSAEAKIKQSKMKVEHLSKTGKKLKADMKKEESAAKALSEKRNKLEAKAKTVQEQIDSLDFNEEYESKLYDKKSHLENEYSNLREEIETLTAQLTGRLSFNYSDPVKGFDRSKVMGLVAKLVSVAQRSSSAKLVSEARQRRGGLGLLLQEHPTSPRLSPTSILLN